MSVQEDIALLAQELSHLAVSGSSVYLDTGGLAAALTARRKVLDLLRAVLYDVAGTRGGAAESLTSTRFGGQPGWLRLGSVVELESNPVAGLARALGVHPTPRIEQGPSDRDDVAEASVTGRGWAQVNRHALVIGHDWASSPPQLTAEQQWSAVADVAALAQVVAVLDQDLYTAASQLQDVDRSVVQALLDATRSGLRTAAGEATALSQVGPLPAWGELAAPASTPIVAPRSPSDVIAAPHRLAAQVVTAGNLSPQAVTLVATGQARLLATAAQALAAVNPHGGVGLPGDVRRVETPSSPSAHAHHPQHAVPTATFPQVTTLYADFAETLTAASVCHQGIPDLSGNPLKP